MTREEAIEIVKKHGILADGTKLESALRELIPELAESEDEMIMSRIIDGFKNFSRSASKWNNIPIEEVIAYLEKQKGNPKSSDSIPSDCTSDAKCEDRWHKVTDSLPDNGRLVLAKDCLGNVLLARYDGENWEVNVYDNEDHYCHNSISKWCEIPSEKQKEQKPWKVGANAYFTPEQKPADLSEMMVHKEPYIAPVPTPMVADEQKPEKNTATINGEPIPTENHSVDIPLEEWSEEDEKYLNRVINLWVNDFGEDNDTVKWLKSLRPQYHGDVTMTEAYKMGLEAGKASSWNPSEEQMTNLLRAEGRLRIEGESILASKLAELYEHLKQYQHG